MTYYLPGTLLIATSFDGNNTGLYRERLDVIPIVSLKPGEVMMVICRCREDPEQTLVVAHNTFGYVLNMRVVTVP